MDWMVPVGLGRFVWHNLYKVPKTEGLIEVNNLSVVHLHNIRKSIEGCCAQNRQCIGLSHREPYIVWCSDIQVCASQSEQGNNTLQCLAQQVTFPASLNFEYLECVLTSKRTP